MQHRFILVLGIKDPSLQDAVCVVAAYIFICHFKYRQAYMTVVPTSSEHDHCSQAGASPAYVLLSQATK